MMKIDKNTILTTKCTGKKFGIISYNINRCSTVFYTQKKTVAGYIAIDACETEIYLYTSIDA